MDADNEACFISLTGMYFMQAADYKFGQVTYLHLPKYRGR